jgi:hypothetical protein
VEFLVEEFSMEVALRALVPRLRPDLSSSFDVHAFDGKDQMFARLPGRLRGYAHCLPDNGRVVVVVDRDDDDCRQLKARIEEMASKAGLRVKTSAAASRFDVLVGLAIEELEAWYLGDVDALVAAYPGLPATLGRKARFRDPDGISNASRVLERHLQRAGHFRSGLRKVELARAVVPHMKPALNVSASFRAFRDGVLSL